MPLLGLSLLWGFAIACSLGVVTLMERCMFMVLPLLPQFQHPGFQRQRRTLSAAVKLCLPTSTWETGNQRGNEHKRGEADSRGQTAKIFFNGRIGSDQLIH